MDLREAYESFIVARPPVHRPGYRDDYDHTKGRWDTQTSSTYSTDFECYEFIAEHVGRGSATMETGLGFSTLCLANAGCRHTAMFLDPAEEAPLRAWADEHGIDLTAVRFVVGPSDVSLRELPDDPVDLFFIDGGHGYPVPQLDWFYGASRLPEGGILVLDDLQFWGPRQLDQFLELDPRWERLASAFKWSGFRRLGSGPVAEDFDTQTFLPELSRSVQPSLRRRLRGSLSRHVPERVKAPVRRVLR